MRPEITEDLPAGAGKTSANSRAAPRWRAKLLQKHGIALVILPHLPHTYLDGACFKSPSGRPVIGLTLRYDRLDNFWFTLMHELSHVYLHLENGNRVFFDDTEQDTSQICNPQEMEANALATALLIPEDLWNREGHTLADSQQIVAFADRLGISPAIVAGRLRWRQLTTKPLMNCWTQNRSEAVNMAN
jgi:HTH-type transcriptional regulator/antitoxin HigA